MPENFIDWLSVCINEPLTKLCDSIKPTYLGGHPHVKSHYRGHHMSVWLQLVPQLHQPGYSDVMASHHQFQDQDDSIYEGQFHLLLLNQIQLYPIVTLNIIMIEKMT